MSDDATESQEWKRKYLELLDELETKERSWNEAQGLLRLAVSRLSLISDASDTHLVKEVGGLREPVRGDLNMVERGLRLERLGELDEGGSTGAKERADKALDQAKRAGRNCCIRV